MSEFKNDVLRVIGLDPGVTTGICVMTADLRTEDYEYVDDNGIRHDCKRAPHTLMLPVQVGQVDPQMALGLVVNAMNLGQIDVVAMEDFVQRRRASHLANPSDGNVTKKLVDTITQAIDYNNERAIDSDLMAHADRNRVALSCHPAGAVKPWATDERLRAAGLEKQLKGRRHAADACRHALFAAVKAGVPDPLSKDWRP